MEESNSLSAIHESGISSIKLSKGQKNTYGWEIKVYGESVDEILSQIERANKAMLVTYGFVPPSNGNDKGKKES